MNEDTNDKEEVKDKNTEGDMLQMKRKYAAEYSNLNNAEASEV